jgi:hypothetical protein
MDSPASQQPFLVSSLLNVLFALSLVDVNLWIDILGPQFEHRFYALALATPVIAVRDAAWESLQAFYTTLCQSISAKPSNGHAYQSDSDSESKMEIDPPSGGSHRLATFLWNTALNCLKNSDRHVQFAGKAFETGASLLR